MRDEIQCPVFVVVAKCRRKSQLILPIDGRRNVVQRQHALRIEEQSIGGVGVKVGDVGIVAIQRRSRCDVEVKPTVVVHVEPHGAPCQVVQQNPRFFCDIVVGQHVGAVQKRRAFTHQKVVAQIRAVAHQNVPIQVVVKIAKGRAHGVDADVDAPFGGHVLEGAVAQVSVQGVGPKRAVVDDVQVEQAVPVHIHPRALERLPHVVPYPSQFGDIVKRHPQVHSGQPTEQLVGLGVGLGRVVVTDVHVQAPVLIVIRDGRPKRSLQVRPSHPSCIRHFLH